RGRTLARAAEQLKVDVSTVFRSVRRLEASVGTSLFEKSRAGYQPTSAAIALSQQAESGPAKPAAARVTPFHAGLSGAETGAEHLKHLRQSEPPRRGHRPAPDQHAAGASGRHAPGHGVVPRLRQRGIPATRRTARD
nr:hypothetical protein [Tanacetum cinerariifolium]